MQFAYLYINIMQTAQNSTSIMQAAHMTIGMMQAALSVKGWERLPRDELVLKACQAVAAVAREKSRCAELVYRLQQTHEDSIEAKQLQARFAELQASVLSHVSQLCNTWHAACSRGPPLLLRVLQAVGITDWSDGHS